MSLSLHLCPVLYFYDRRYTKMSSILQTTPLAWALQNVAEASATCLPRGLPSSRRSPPRYRTTLVLLREHLRASVGVPSIYAPRRCGYTSGISRGGLGASKMRSVEAPAPGRTI